MRLGIAQIATRAGELSRTGERIVEQSKQAAEQNVDLLVFSAAVLTGPDPMTSINNETLLMDVIDVMQDLASQVACPTIVPAVFCNEIRTYVECFLLLQGQVIPLQTSHFMSQVMGAEDNVATHALAGKAPDYIAQFTSALQRLQRRDRGLGEESSSDKESDSNIKVGTFDSGFISFDMADLHFVLALDPSDLQELLDYEYPVDVMIYLPRLGYALNDASRTLGAAVGESPLLQDVRAAGAWIAAAGPLGCYGRSIYTGGSYVLAPTGELVAAAPSFEEALITAELVPTSTLVSQIVGAQEHGISYNPLAPEIYDRFFFCWQALSFGLSEFVHNNGYTDVVLALDGSLSASITAVLACDALGPTHVHALLATPFTGIKSTHLRRSAKHLSFAWKQVCAAAHKERNCRRLAKNLRLDMVEREARLLSAAAVLLGDSSSEAERLAAADMDEGLVRAELATLAASTGSLILSSRDKTWLAFEARGGTASADLLPLGDIYRSDLLELARMRNAISPVLPDLVLSECDMPALELSEDEQTLPPVRPGSRTFEAVVDEALLVTVDSIVMEHVEWDNTLTDIARTFGEEEVELLGGVFAQLDRHALARASAGVVLRAATFDLGDAAKPLGCAWQDTLHTPFAELDNEDSDEFFDELNAYLTRQLIDAYDDKELEGLESVAERLFENEDLPDNKDDHSGFDDEFGSNDRRSGLRSEDYASPAGHEVEDFLNYLRDLTEELGGSGEGGNFGGHLSSDGRGNLSFGGFSASGANPFSEN